MADGMEQKKLDEYQRKLSETFEKAEVDFVPDPMVLRAAELFLLGRRGLREAEIKGTAEDVWSVIERNIDGILAFFHVLMTRQRIPLIDYGITFPGTKVMGLIKEDLAVDIHPDEAFYEALRDEAQSKVADLDLSRLGEPMLNDLVRELGTSGYEWFPGNVRYEDRPEGERVAATFVTGGIIFGGYAQAAGAEHLLQSKRAWLFAELSAPTAAEAVPDNQETESYARWRAAVEEDERFSATDYRLPPSIVPLLLALKPKSAVGLLDKAIELRNQPVGEAYRTWHTDVRKAWSRGILDPDAETTLREISEEVDKRVAERNGPIAGLDLVFPTSLNFAVAGPLGRADRGISGRPIRVGVPDRLRNWIVERLRFRGHRKLLLRMTLAQANLKNLTEQLKNLWKDS